MLEEWKPSDCGSSATTRKWLRAQMACQSTAVQLAARRRGIPAHAPVARELGQRVHKVVQWGEPAARRAACFRARRGCDQAAVAAVGAATDRSCGRVLYMRAKVAGLEVVKLRQHAAPLGGAHEHRISVVCERQPRHRHAAHSRACRCATHGAVATASRGIRGALQHPRLRQLGAPVLHLGSEHTRRRRRQLLALDAGMHSRGRTVCMSASMNDKSCFTTVSAWLLRSLDWRRNSSSTCRWSPRRHAVSDA
jgi:hypothetical protein